MTVTYINSAIGVKVPKLHRVKYAEAMDHVDAYYHRSYLDHRVDAWLSENCQHPYYHSPGYLKVKFIEFEDDQEAAWFKLRWA